MGDRTNWLVVNAASGSNSEDAVGQIVLAFASAGEPFERIVRLPQDELPDTAQLQAQGVDLLVTFTGDGTANAQIARLDGWTGQVLVLPGGTQNLLAKRLHGQASVQQIIDAYQQGHLKARRIDMVRSAYGDALCEMLVGPGATWSDVRETMRDGDVAAMATTLAEAIRKSAAGAAVCVAQPPLGKAEGYPAVRLSPCGKAMAVDGYGAEGLGDYARQGVAILRRDFRQGPHDTLGLHPDVLCRSSEAIELMIDGERATGSAEERFTIAPCPVEFLALV